MAPSTFFLPFSIYVKPNPWVRIWQHLPHYLDLQCLFSGIHFLWWTSALSELGCHGWYSAGEFATLIYGTFQLKPCTNQWFTFYFLLQYVVVPTRRATAEALQISFAHLLGDAGSPYLIGVVRNIIIFSHHTFGKQHESYRRCCFPCSLLDIWCCKLI